MMNLYDHYYILLIGAFSSHLGTAFFITCSILWNFLIWEVRTWYSSKHSHKVLECERLLAKITKTYWCCTNHRVFVGRDLCPTGYIMGDGFYIARIKMNDEKGEKQPGNPSYQITLYGWWSIRELLTADIEVPVKQGGYKIVRSIDGQLIKTTDDYDAAHFHSNCAKGAALIRGDIIKAGSGGGVFLLHGAPGLGKTTTARYLANQLGAWLCLDFEELCYESENFVIALEKIVQYIQPDALTPLIIVLDELEDFLFVPKSHSWDHDHEKGSKKDVNQPVFKNRATKKRWVRLLDTLQEKKHVIFVLTTNKPKSYFDDIDSALLRDYRVTKSLFYKSKGIRTR